MKTHSKTARPKATASPARTVAERGERTLLTVDEAADRLGVTPTWVRREVNENRWGLPWKRVGKLLRFDPAALDEWLEQQDGNSGAA